MDNLQYSKKNNIGMNNFRFANILNHNSSSVGFDSIKRAVKTVKSEALLDLSYGGSSNPIPF